MEPLRKRLRVFVTIIGITVREGRRELGTNSSLVDEQELCNQVNFDVYAKKKSGARQLAIAKNAYVPMQ